MGQLRFSLLSVFLLLGGLQIQAQDNDEVIDLQELLLTVSKSLTKFGQEMTEKFALFTTNFRNLDNDMKEVKSTLAEIRKSSAQSSTSNQDIRQIVDRSSSAINNLGQNINELFQQTTANLNSFQKEVKDSVKLSAENLATLGFIVEENTKKSSANFKSFEQLLREIASSSSNTGTCTGSPEKYQEILTKLQDIKELSLTIKATNQGIKEEVQKTTWSINSIVQSQKEIKETVTKVKEVTNEIHVINNEAQQGRDTCSASIEKFLKEHKSWKESLTEKIDKVVEKHGTCNNENGKDEDNGKDDDGDNTGQDVGPVIDCWDVYRKFGIQTNGLYNIKPMTSNAPFPVYCDMTDGGGWTVIQKRGEYGNPSDYFYRSWSNYKIGFGNLNKEFWLGNDKIFALTSQTAYELKIDLWDYSHNRLHARYNDFKIGNELSRYRLQIGGYSGTAGNAMKNHNSLMFSTHDQDNTGSRRNCFGEDRSTGWWHGACDTNLNGVRGQSMKWLTADYSFGVVTMKIRPKGVM